MQPTIAYIGVVTQAKSGRPKLPREISLTINLLAHPAAYMLCPAP